MTSAHRRFALRNILSVAILLAIVALVAGAWLVDGLVFPIVVDSGSMAESLLGPHRRVTCASCGWNFACGGQPLAVDQRAVCPNCGHGGNDLAEVPELSGHRLIVDRLTYQCRSPRRWETVVFRCPQQPEHYCVKRIVGLPGETIAVRHGDVYVDGQVLRKSLAELEALAITVHDSQFTSPAASEPARWQRADKTSRWRAVGSGFVYENMLGEIIPGEKSPADFLVYQHRQAGTGGASVPGPIQDDLGYNQAQSRVLNQVTDVLLRCRLQAAGSGQLVLRIGSGDQRFTLELTAATGHGSLRHNDEAAAGFSAGAALLQKPTVVEWGVFDAQVVLALDGEVLLSYPFKPSASPRQTGSEPLAIGAQELEVQVEYLQALRDVYYTDGVLAGSDVQLGPDEYFVLGDNSSASDDSRTWSGNAGLLAKMLVGKPLLVLDPR